MSLRVLITNTRLDGRTGTGLFVCDLARELRRQGHTPAVFAPWHGPLAAELSASGITVTDSLKRLDFQPDIIHGHHRYETLSAIMRFRGAPALFVCHDHTCWTDTPPIHSRILRYFGVSKLCIERLRAAGVPEQRIAPIYNSVDLQRFKLRPPLPERPKRALLFSNYASDGGYVRVVEEACRRAGLELTTIGSGVGNLVARPEDVLGHYDIVFAKARAVMEAMAVGAAVVLCDYGGLGPMVTPQNIESLRPLNFGFQALTEPHTSENLLRQIEKYDRREAQEVRDIIRSTQGLEQAVHRMVDIYQAIIDEYRTHPTRNLLSDAACWGPITRCAVAYKLKKVWLRLPAGRRDAIFRACGQSLLKSVVRRLFYR